MSAPQPVWIVTGETGEYSDYTEWNVAGFTTEELAIQFQQFCQKEADSYMNNKNRKFRNGFKHSRDTQFYCDYTGTMYNVAMVEVHDHIPEPSTP